MYDLWRLSKIKMRDLVIISTLFTKSWFRRVSKQMSNSFEKPFYQGFVMQIRTVIFITKINHPIFKVF